MLGVRGRAGSGAGRGAPRPPSPFFTRGWDNGLLESPGSQRAGRPPGLFPRLELCLEDALISGGGGGRSGRCTGYRPPAGPVFGDLRFAEAAAVTASHAGSMVLVVKNPPASAGDAGLVPASGRSPGEGNGSPLQYSCLENPMDPEPGRLQSMGSQKSWI